MEGTPFGRYRLVGMLGRGGMGEVWRAYDTRTDRVVAIKVLPAQFATDDEYNTRFRREAHSAAGLDSPHVIPIHDYGEIGGQLYVDMRLVNGQDLAQAISAGPLKPVRAVHIIDQIAGALHAAHQVGLIHRDVKPSNILLDRDDYAYLIDFGIAQALHDTSTDSATTMGTWAYMAPERFTDGPVDARSDVYSLACVLYECLTGRRPFAERTLDELAAAHLHGPIPRPTQVDSAIPIAFDQVIDSGLAKSPVTRCPTTKELAARAREALGGEWHIDVRRRVAGATFEESAESAAAQFPWPPHDDAARSPYRGWKPLDEADAAVYFGRSTQISRALDTIGGMRAADSATLFVILGPSGTGKSSFLRAGLLPRLRLRPAEFELLDIVRPQHNVLTGYDGLAQALHTALGRHELATPSFEDVGQICRSGDVDTITGWLNDIRRCAGADSASLPTLVLPVDQGEELFGVDGEAEAHTFLDLVAVLAARMNGPAGDGQLGLLVAVTIRTDRYELLQTASQLADVRSVVFDELKPLPRTAFRDVIIGPAARSTRGGRPLTLEPALVDRLLDDCGEGADTLPLLALTMARLFDDYATDPSAGDEDPTTLTLARYEAFGGIGKVVNTEIDKTIATDAVDRAAELQLLRTAFIPWLATINPLNNQPMRRIARWIDLPETSRPLVDRLVTRRLLVRSDHGGHTTVEVALESLLRQWDDLAQWLVEERENIKAADTLEHAAAAWHTNERDEAWLLQGARLTAAERLAVAPMFAGRLAWLREFLDVSRERENTRALSEARRRDAELAAAQQLAATESSARADALRHTEVLRKRSRVLRAVLAVAVVVALVAAGGWAYAFWALQQSETREREAIALRLTSQGQAMMAGLEPGGDVRAIQQILAAQRISPDINEGGLLTALTAHSDLVKIVETDPEGLIEALSPDGTRVLQSRGDAMRLLDSTTGEQVVELANTESAGLAVFSPDGRRIAVPSSGSVLIWDADTGQKIVEVPPLDEDTWIEGLAFSPDGRSIACGGDNGVAWIIDIESADVRGTPMSGHGGYVSAVAFSPDGSRLVTGDDEGTVRVWDLEARSVVGKPLTIDGGNTTALTYSPDGHHIMAGFIAGEVGLWDAQTGEPEYVPNDLLHDGWVNTVAFSPDSDHMVSAGSDGALYVWGGDLDDTRLAGHDEGVTAVAFTPDGKYIFSGGSDGSVRLWDAKPDQYFGDSANPFRDGNVVSDGSVLAISPDATMFATGSFTGPFRVWHTGDDRPIEPLTAQDDITWSAAFSPDGRRVVTGHSDGVRLWDTQTGELLSSSVTDDSEEEVRALVFSPNGRQVVYGRGGLLQIWDVDTDRTTAPRRQGHDIQINAIAFSHDGARLVSADADGVVRIWDANVWEPVGNPLPGYDEFVTAVAFTDDGRVVSGGATGVLRIWDADTGELVRILRGDDSGVVYALAVSPNGRFILSGGDTPLRLWDANSGQAIGPTLTDPGESIDAVAFRQDGSFVSGGFHGVRVWPSPDEWPDLLCDRIAYNMNEQQWDQWVSPDIEYIPVCEGLEPAPSTLQ